MSPSLILNTLGIALRRNPTLIADIFHCHNTKRPEIALKHLHTLRENVGDLLKPNTELFRICVDGDSYLESKHKKGFTTTYIFSTGNEVDLYCCLYFVDAVINHMVASGHKPSVESVEDLCIKFKQIDGSECQQIVLKTTSYPEMNCVGVDMVVTRKEEENLVSVLTEKLNHPIDVAGDLNAIIGGEDEEGEGEWFNWFDTIGSDNDDGSDSTSSGD